MSKMSWLQAENQMRMEEIRYILCCGELEYMDLLDEYVLLVSMDGERHISISNLEKMKKEIDD